MENTSSNDTVLPVNTGVSVKTCKGLWREITLFPAQNRKRSFDIILEEMQIQWLIRHSACCTISKLNTQMKDVSPSVDSTACVSVHHLSCVVVVVGNAFPAAEESVESLEVEGSLQRAWREELDARAPQIPQLWPQDGTEVWQRYSPLFSTEAYCIHLEKKKNSGFSE